MKTFSILFLTLFINSFNTIAQSSLLVTDYSNNQTPIPNNGYLFVTTTSGSYESTTINIKNTTANTKVYTLKRFDDVLNTGAAAYVKMGSSYCFPPSTTLIPVSVTLTPNGTANDNSNSQNLMYILHLDEAVNPGVSHIRYEIFDVNNTSDSFTFTIYYNDVLSSVKESAQLFKTISDVYPNPTLNKAHISITSERSLSNVSLSITNSLGAVVATKHIDLSAGENDIILDSELLNSGIYFATFFYNDKKIVKRFIVNK